VLEAGGGGGVRVGVRDRVCQSAGSLFGAARVSSRGYYRRSDQLRCIKDNRQPKWGELGWPLEHLWQQRCHRASASPLRR